MAASNADKNVNAASSSPVTTDETVKDLDPRVSDEEQKNVKGGTETFAYGGLVLDYHPQTPDGKP